MSLIVVYILPQVDTDTALSELHEAISSYQVNYPDGALVIAGDFYHANLKRELIPDSYTRGERTLDYCYSLCIDGSKSIICLYLGF